MDLFCFTLEGSTESIYEPVNSHALKEVLPKYQCTSGRLRCKAEWGGSDPSINSDKDQTMTRPKGEYRRSCKGPVTLEDKTLACSESDVLTRDVQMKEPVSEKPRTDLPAQNDEATRREGGPRRTCTKRRRQSRNSLESLYSLKSGRSSSSGVTSGSNCSSNRESLRLEDDLMLTREFCCRARVHTEFVPSPYDTESLTLKVGDVIDVIAKPHMGTWTGSLNGQIGTFKFIYVDVLTHSSGPNPHEVRQKSTVLEVLRRLSLEEYSSSLELSSYQTVDDLMKLRESDLIQLNVTDPEHRERLLAAVNSLQQLHSDSLLEKDACPVPEKSNEDTKGDMKSRPRDSGCVMTSDSPDPCAFSL
ncbi:SAM domain-containing protein SAMSN-1b isoform X2 [Fundulus heteroclitus]|uniref:SAM domain-containing protein SAMSN-1b isoform X2 n=1 Tax=Fundulus heteroclitus TaxID=8078 RepID=UPI00165B6A6D|nr:SAM domain-containing protein SAMSN-1b isoform X2 [Fundulus heteroclitus]